MTDEHEPPTPDLDPRIERLDKILAHGRTRITQALTFERHPELEPSRRPAPDLRGRWAAGERSSRLDRSVTSHLAHLRAPSRPTSCGGWIRR